jgi:hypothetical protein
LDFATIIDCRAHFLLPEIVTVARVNATCERGFRADAAECVLVGEWSLWFGFCYLILAAGLIFIARDSDASGQCHLGRASG